MNKKMNEKNKPEKIIIDEDYFPRSHSIQLLPTPKQKRIINDWIASTRKVWNVALHDINKNVTKIVDKDLQNKFVIAKNMSSTIKTQLNWTLRTPKRIREYAIKDLVSTYKSCETKMDKKQIRHYTIHHKIKTDKKQNICISHESSYIRNGNLVSNGLDIKLNEKIEDQEIKHNMRLVRIEGIYFIHIPYFTTIKSLKTSLTNDIVGIDPGENIYHTYYSPNGEYGIIGSDIKTRLINIYDKQEKIKNKITKKNRLNKAIKKTSKRKVSLIDDFQWKLCHWYLRRFRKIIIPRLYISKRYSEQDKKIQNDMKHCKFVDRLIYKSCLYSNTEIHECKEHYTSQACTRCGSLKTVKGKTVSCGKCGFIIHRDLSGARNMVIKHLREN